MPPSAISRMKSATERRLGHVVFGSRDWIEKQVAGVAASTGTGRVLEIGSGKHDFGADAYSMKSLFPSTCEFVQSDFNPEFGHLVVDITTMEFDAEYDLILCISVFEHVPNFWDAVPRLHKALKPGGRLVLSTPMNFPYHDEPADYYRFTAHGLRMLLSDFSSVDVRHRGARRLPFTVLAVAER